MSVIFFSNMLIFNGMFYDLFDKKRTIYGILNYPVLRGSL